MKVKHFFLMILIAGMCCIINATPVFASSTTATGDSSVIEITSPLELAEALGGDASWVNGNEVTLESDISSSETTLKFTDSEVILNLNGYSMSKYIKIDGGEFILKGGKIENRIEIASGNLSIFNCEMGYRIIVNGGNVTVTDCSKVLFFTEGGDITVTDSSVEIIRNRGTGSMTVTECSVKEFYNQTTGNTMVTDCRVIEFYNQTTGNTMVTDCSLGYFDNDYGNTIISGCEITGTLKVDGGMILLKQLDGVSCIETLRGLFANIKIGDDDADTVVITTLGDFDSDISLAYGVLGPVYVAAKEAVTYYDLPEIGNKESRDSIILKREAYEGMMYIKAETKELATTTDQNKRLYFGKRTIYETSREETLTRESLRIGYMALRLYRLEDGKIAVTRPYEKFLDSSIYPPRYVWVKEKDYQTVEITWYPSRDAKGYQIYRSTEKDGKYTRIAEINDKNITQYLDTTVMTKFKYYYKVRNIIETGENADYSPLSEPHDAKTKLNSTVVETSSADYKSIKLSWSKVDGATGYTIYRLNSKGKEEVIKTVLGEDVLSYIDTGRKTNKEYTYRIRAFRDMGDIRVYGAKTDPCTGMALVGAPEVSTVAEAYDKIKVSWNSVPGADGYYVYRAEKTKGEYTLIKDISDKDTLFYVDTGRTCGKNYYYKVQSYYVVTNEGQDGLSSDEKIDGETSAFVSGKALPSAPTITVKKSSSTSAKITWKKVSGADGYQIYTYDRTKKKYVLLDTVGTDIRTYTAKGLTKGVKHYFKVRAYKIVNEKKVNGAFSEIVKVAF